MSSESTSAGKVTTFPISSRMQKELQYVGAGLALDKLKEQGEMPNVIQYRYIYNIFHGDAGDKNSIGLVEMMMSGTGIAEDMYFAQETEIVDPNTPTKTTATSLQMKDICTLNPEKAYIVGRLVTAEMLHSSTKKVGAPWITGRTLLNQGTEVHRNCKKALGYGRKFLDPEGFCKSGNLQIAYFNYVNACMHELEHPEMHEEKEGEDALVLGSAGGKPTGWMFHGYIFFVLYSPRVEKEVSIENVSDCFSRCGENLKGKKTSHGRAAARKKSISEKNSARISQVSKETSLGGKRGMDMKNQLGTAMVCAQLGHLKQQKLRMKAETVGGLLLCAQSEKKDSIEMLKIFEKDTEEWNEAMEDLKKASLQVRELMAEMSKISALHGDDVGRKRSAEEEIAEDFVESLRKRPALATLHQPSQLSQEATSPISQMVDLQALENLRDEDAAKSNGRSVSRHSDIELLESDEGDNGDAAPDYIDPTIATATPGASIDNSEEENDGFPYCGAGKYCTMPNKRLNADCYDWNEKPKHRCKKCRHVLHGALCGSGEGKEMTCHKCIAKE